MKLRGIFTLFIIVFTLVALNSCSEDDNGTDPNNNDPTDYFPLFTGSWWSNDNYDLNMDQSRNENSLVKDSTAVTGTETVLGKEAHVFTTYSESGEEMDYFYTEGSKLYARSNYILPGGDGAGADLPLQLDDSWILIADMNGSEWPIAEKPISNFSYKVDGIGTAKISGTYKVTAKKGVMETLDIAGESMACQEFQIMHSFNGKASISIISVNLNFTLVSHYWYSENVGLVRYKLDSEKINIGDLTSEDVNGFEYIVTDYFVNK